MKFVQKLKVGHSSSVPYLDPQTVQQRTPLFSEMQQMLCIVIRRSLYPMIILLS